MNDFYRRAFENAKILGCSQYVLEDFDKNDYYNKIKDEKTSVFEFELENKILFSEKSCFFNGNKISFWNLGDIGFVLTKEKFIDTLMYISKMICKGSEIVFDYPAYVDVERKGYSYGEIENMLEKCGFLIYEHISDNTVKNSIFCLAVRK